MVDPLAADASSAMPASMRAVAPRAVISPLTCRGCPSLVTRLHPAGTIGPHGTSARCLAANGGTRIIGWEWQPKDTPPHWCPRRSLSA